MVTTVLSHVSPLVLRHTNFGLCTADLFVQRWKCAYRKTFSTASATRNADWHKYPRIYVENSAKRNEGDIVTLSEDVSHYIVNVMRLRDGSIVRGFNESIGEYLYHVTNIRQQRKGYVCSLSVVRRLRAANVCKPLPCVLFFAPIKKDRLKLLLEKATELGVRHLVPVLTQNTNYPLKGPGGGAGSEGKALDQLRQLLVQSAEQCERISIPVLHNQIRLTDLVSVMQRAAEDRVDNATTNNVNGIPATVAPSHLLVGKERDTDATPLLTALLQQRHMFLSEGSGDNAATGRAPFGVLVGPEGGFTTAEMESLKAVNSAELKESNVEPVLASPKVQFVSLGPTVLRAETAGIAALSVVSAVYHMSLLEPSIWKMED